MSSVSKILEDKPFHHLFTIAPSTIVKIEIEGSESDAIFFIHANSKRYKLRVCESEKEAQRIEQNIKLVPEVVPKFHGRDRQYILTEVLEGYRMLTHEDILEHAERIGKLCALTNVHRGIHVEEERRFLTHLAGIRELGFMSKELHDDIAATFKQLAHLKPPHLRLDLDDLHKGNFMINDHGTIYYVDEESVDFRMQGMGLGKLLKLFDRKDWKRFLQGYGEVEDSSIFSDEYIMLIEFVELVRIMEKKLRQGVDATDELILLERMLLRLKPIIPLNASSSQAF